MSTSLALGQNHTQRQVPFEHAAQEIVLVGQYLGQQGLVPATSGNFSRRIDEEHIAITASGFDKGFLTTEHILYSPIIGTAPANSSAETELHRALYRDDANINAVLHTHSVASTLLSQKYLPQGEIRLKGYEIQKALFGIPTHHDEAVILVFENDQDIVALEKIITPKLQDVQGTLVGYLLSNHGLYTWGNSLEQARRHVIGIEFLLQCELEKLRWSPAQ